LKVRKLLSLFFFAYIAKQEKSGKEDHRRFHIRFGSKTFSCYVDFREIEVHTLSRLKTTGRTKKKKTRINNEDDDYMVMFWIY
jgi:hypothetical protein